MNTKLARSRSNRKNGNCYVEQKNCASARRIIGCKVKKTYYKPKNPFGRAV
jgi:hypothetical protein